MKPSFNVFISVILSTMLFCQCSNSSQGQNDKASSQVKILLDESDCIGPDTEMKCAFVGMPKKLTSVMEIKDETGLGEPLIISGNISNASNNEPFSDLIIYAYQTDHTGKYTKSGNETGVQLWHGRLHGWCKTDSEGYYEIRTIRPAPYPNDIMPAHIHLTVLEPSDTAYYINDIVFADDAFVTEKYIENLNAKGGNGVVEVSLNDKGVWVGKRDFEL